MLVGATREIRSNSLFKSLAFVGITLVATVVVGSVAGFMAIVLGIEFPESMLGMKLLLVPFVVVVVVAVFYWPIVGVLLLTFTIPIENVVVFGGATTGVKILGMVVFGAWILKKLSSRGSWRPILSANLLVPGILFVLFAFASMFWAGSVGATLVGFLTLVQLLALSLLVIDVVDSWRRLEWVVRFLMLGGLVALALTLRQSMFVERAGADIAGNQNETALYLVVLIPFAFYLLRASKGHLWRLLGLVYIGLAPAGIGVTNSRAAFLILPLVLGSQVWEMFKGRPRHILYLSLVGLVVAGIVWVVLPAGPREGVLQRGESVLQRGKTIIPAILGGRTEGGNFQNGRITTWQGAIAVFGDHPLWGVGYGNFGYQFRSLQSSDPDRYVRPLISREGAIMPIEFISWSPHSSLLGISAELGLIGTALLIWILVGALLITRRSWTRSKRANSRFQEILAQAMFYILLAYILYGVGGVIHSQKLLWLLLGLAEVLRRVTMHSEELSRNAGTDVDTPTVQTGPQRLGQGPR